MVDIFAIFSTIKFGFIRKKSYFCNNKNTHSKTGKEDMEANLTKKIIRQYSNQPRSYYIGERNTNKFIYKYIDLESAIISLASDSVRFVEPTQWQDQYESRFYNASYANVANALGNTPAVLASCFSFAPVNESAWRLYSYQKNGLGAHCIQLRINKKAFREQILKNNKGYRLYEGMVNYSLDNYQIDNIHKSHTSSGKENVLFYDLFKGFDLSSYMSLLLLKRQAFRHEQEIRYFLVSDQPMLKGYVEYEDIRIEWKNVLEDIKVDEHCSDLELGILNKILSSKDITITPKREFIYSNPDSHIVIDPI